LDLRAAAKDKDGEAGKRQGGGGKRQETSSFYQQFLDPPMRATGFFKQFNVM